MDNIFDPLNDNSSMGDDMPSDEKRFTDSNVIYKACREFWQMISPIIVHAKTSELKFVYDNPYGNYLIELIYWTLHVADETTRYENLRRINNNFGSLGDRELEIRRAHSALYELYLKKYPKDRDTLVSELFDINKFMTKRLESSTRPNLITQTVRALSGKRSVLIEYDPQTGSSHLQLEHQVSGLKLLTGPTSSKSSQSNTKSDTPKYPGHTLDESVLARNINWLVENEFDITKPLQDAIDKNKIGQSLGQLYSAIDALVKGKDLPLMTVSKKDIRESMGLYTKPVRLKDKSLNIFGNVLMECIKDDQQFRPSLNAGMFELCKSLPNLFSEMAWEFFQISEDSFTSTAYSPTPTAEQVGTKINTANTSKIPTSSKSSLSDLENEITHLNPLSRLSAIYRSGQVDMKKLKDYDSYVKDILCLILCGKTKPTDDILRKGYLAWQKIVHPDTNPDDTVKKFASIISEIGELARKREFIREDGSKAIAQIFDIVSEMMDSHSIVIIPRQAFRHMVIGGTLLSDILIQNKYELNSVKVVVSGKLIGPENFQMVKLTAGQIIEVISIQ